MDMSKKIELAQNSFYFLSPKYMAPEQSMSLEINDPIKCDVYAMGCILFNLLFRVSFCDFHIHNKVIHKE
jgi:serine/threonine protein kinase